MPKTRVFEREKWSQHQLTCLNRLGQGFGTREAGMGTLPGGSESSGSTGIVFKQIAALGEAGWPDATWVATALKE